MPLLGEITHRIELLKAGDADAAQPLWESYYQQLLGLARSKLRGLRRGMADEEDVVLSAFASFCRGAERGRFPQLTDRTDLWKLLIVLTARKACDLRANQIRRKRGGGKVAGESALPGGDEAGLAGVIGREPTPAFAAEMAEQYQRLLAILDDDLREVAVLKFEGFTNEEIGVRIDRAVATVERKLRLIRDTWDRKRHLSD